MDKTQISEEEFKNKTLPKDSTIPNSVKSIGNNAFYNVRLSRWCVWLDKDGKQINIPIAGAKVGLQP